MMQGYVSGSGYFEDISTEVHVEQSMKKETSTFETKSKHTFVTMFQFIFFAV